MFATHKLPLMVGIAALASVLLLAPVTAESEESAGVDALRERFHAALSAEQWSDLCFMAQLGWRVVEDPEAKTIRAHGGTPARRESLEESQAAGDLLIRVPVGVSADRIRAFGPELETLSLSIASRCAYQLKLQAPLETAIEKLVVAAEGGRYGFPELLGITCPQFQCKPPRPEWIEVERGQLWRPRERPSDAVASIYNKTSVIECYVAQWLATWATQYELYGAKWFDQTFSVEDVAIGTSRTIRTTPFGRFMRVQDKHEYVSLVVTESQQKSEISRALLAYGRKTLIGLGGIIKCERLGLDAFENFVIVSVSKDAADSLRKRGGLGFVEWQAKKIWEIDEEISGLFVNQRYRAKRRKEIDDLFADPALSEFMIYIHPYGVMSLADIGKKKLGLRSTPISAGIYTHGREDAFYRRYRQAWKKRCVSGGGLRVGEVVKETATNGR